MRAVTYARVSSQAQREKHTIGSQLELLPTFVAAQGWTLKCPVETYVDDGRTATAGHLEGRDAFTRLLADAGAGLFDVVAVVDLDRLTRSEDLAERGAILGAFQRAGVKIAIASTGQVLDLASSMGDLLSGLQAFFAAEENRKRRERTGRGRLEAIRRGRKPPGATPYGWNYRHDRHSFEWSLHPEQAPTACAIYERAAAGASLYDLQSQLQDEGAPRPRQGHWTREGIRKLIRNSAYRGEWVCDVKRGLVLKVPRIVTDDLWHAGNDMLVARRTCYVMPRGKRVAVCEGIAYCETCGSKLWLAHGSTDRTGERRYVCRWKQAFVRDLARAGRTRCPNRSYLVEKADALVWAAIVKWLDNPELLADGAELAARPAAAAKDWEAEAAGYDRMLSKLQGTEENVLALNRRGKVSQGALGTELDRIAADRRTLERNRDIARQQAARASRRIEDTRAAISAVAGARGRVERASAEERRELVRFFVPVGDSDGRIVMGPSGIVIHGVLRLDQPAELALPRSSLSAASSGRSRHSVIRFALVA